MAKGRPRHANKRRTQSGRIKRDNYPEPKLVQPSDWVAKQRARFGEYYSSALGRAYAAGLLGDGNDAKGRIDGAKKFVRLYRVIVGSDIYRCPLNDTPRGGGGPDVDVDEREHRWLFKAMDAMDVAGVRMFLDQLITTLHTDRGPDWLDRLLSGGTDPRDRMVLDAAMRALDIVSPPPRKAQILVGRWDSGEAA